MAQKLSMAAFDIETTGLKADFAKVLVVVIKEPEKKPKVYRIDEMRAENLADDSTIVKAVIDDLNQYPILIAHNGVRFDKPFLNTRSLFWGLDSKLIVPNGKFIDPCLLARRHLMIGYNSLERVGNALKCKTVKTPIDFRAWMAASFLHDKAALDYITEHCVADVVLLEEIMVKMMPFVGNINGRGSV